MGDLTVNIFSPKEHGSYRMKYFRLNGANVTDQVTSGGGLQFELPEGKAKTFRMQIRAKTGTTIGASSRT